MERRILREIWGVVLIGIAVFLFIILVTHDPYDPSFNVSISSPVVHNWGGIMGARVSEFILTSIGISGFIIPIILFVFGIDSLRGLSLEPLRFLYLLFLLIVTSVGLQVVKDMAGGVLGKWIVEVSKNYIGYIGVGFFSVVLFFVFLTLSLRISPYTAIRWIGEKIADFVIFVRDRIQILRERRRKAKERAEEKRREEAFTPHIEIKTKTPSTFKTPLIRIARPLQEKFEFVREEEGEYELPEISLLDEPPEHSTYLMEEEIKENCYLLERKLRDFGVSGKVVEAHAGPLITVYEFEPAPGVRVGKITSLADDIALGMKAESVRIVAPLPGKGRVGIEIANTKREKVYLSEIIASSHFQRSPYNIPIALGKDISGNPVIADMEAMPHLLIAGSTGSGKSVCLHSIILSLLYKFTPNDLKFIFIDVKRTELTLYNGIPHLLHEVVERPNDTPIVFRWLVDEMTSRYRQITENGMRDISSYNELAERENELPRLPRIVVVVDEMAELMFTAPKEIEEYITRLSQMARAAGIHLIFATQRPSTDVITGIIKANFPARISFKVVSKVDSKTILDMVGAEHLLGKGDMLFLKPGASRPQRVHGAFVSIDEVKRVAEFWRNQGASRYQVDFNEVKERVIEMKEDLDDPKYQEALEILFREGEISISRLQRRLKIGFNRAGRIVDRMVDEGIVVKDPLKNKYVLNPAAKFDKEET